MVTFAPTSNDFLSVMTANKPQIQSEAQKENKINLYETINGFKSVSSTPTDEITSSNKW
jgi:hypothetical protein